MTTLRIGGRSGRFFGVRQAEPRGEDVEPLDEDDYEQAEVGAEDAEHSTRRRKRRRSLEGRDGIMKGNFLPAKEDQEGERNKDGQALC